MKKINILLFLSYSDQSAGGVRQYTEALIRQLAQLPSKYSIFVLNAGNEPSTDRTAKEFVNINLIDYGKFRFGRVKKFITKGWNFLARRWNKKIRFKLPVPKNEIEIIAKKFSIDIVHCPYQYLPDCRNTKRICTLHDVQELHFPEFFTPEQRAYRAVNYNRFLKEADAVIVSYSHIKNDLITYFQVNPEKIFVVLLKMNNLWFSRFNKSDKKDLQTYQLPERFLLYPANTWKHKNHIAVLKAVNLLKQEKNETVNIVFTGDKLLPNYTRLSEYAEEKGLSANIFFMGVVDEETLYALYMKCTGVVVPTLYEAGSFPLMESIMLERPVVCSNVTSLPETIGDSRFVFDPSDIKDVAEKVHLIWSDDVFRNQSVENAIQRQPSLINTNAEDNILRCYESLLT